MILAKLGHYPSAHQPLTKVGRQRFGVAASLCPLRALANQVGIDFSLVCEVVGDGAVYFFKRRREGPCDPGFPWLGIDGVVTHFVVAICLTARMALPPQNESLQPKMVRMRSLSRLGARPGYGRRAIFSCYPKNWCSETTQGFNYDHANHSLQR